MNKEMTETTKPETYKPETYYIFVRPKGSFSVKNRFISINKSTSLDRTAEDITVSLVDNLSEATLFGEELQDALNMVKFFYNKKDYTISVATITQSLL